MIQVMNITKSYGNKKNQTQILKGVSFEIKNGDFTVILGASGSGKSTLLNIISGLERPDSGNILYDETELTTLSDKEMTEFRKNNIGFVFQQYYLLSNLNVDQNIKMGADLAQNDNYQNLLKAVGLEEKRTQYPAELSGGEQQRVSIARALAKKPKVLFLDEPTGALDENTGRQVLDTIGKLQKDYGFTVVMVTHNTNIAEMANTVIRMNSGTISHSHINKTPKTAYQIGW